jgi:hypothetical protein
LIRIQHWQFWNRVRLCRAALARRKLRFRGADSFRISSIDAPLRESSRTSEFVIGEAAKAETPTRKKE